MANIQFMLLFSFAGLLLQVEGLRSCGQISTWTGSLTCQCPDGCSCPSGPYTGDSCPVCKDCNFCGTTMMNTYALYCPEGTPCDVSTGLCKYQKKKCFPGDSTVTVHGESKKISEANVGDMVQVVQKDGSLAYERLFVFTHRAANELMDVILLSTNTGHKVEASPGHYILVGPKKELIPIRDVLVGDIVWVAKSNNLLEGTPVMKKEAKQASVGAFAPHTASGTILVGNVAMSCFTEHVHHQLAAYLLALVQLASKILGNSVFQSVNNHVLSAFNKYSA